MKKMALFVIGVCFWAAMDRSAAVAEDEARCWPQWRGPLHNGVAPRGNPPITWSEQQNVKWKVRCPGHGTASPIVWDDKVFILAAVETGQRSDAAEPQAVGPERRSEPQTMPGREPTMPRHGAGFGGAGTGHPGGTPQAPPSRRGGWGHPLVGSKPSVPYRCQVLCLDRQTGKTLWLRTAREEIPHQAHHSSGGYASFSPVTDGKHVYAYFGSRGLHCYDFQGNRKWQKDLGKMNIVMQFGEGGSPALHGDRIIVNFDHQGDSFIIALDKRTGETIWKVARDEGTSWSTPLVVEVDGQAQVIVSATGKVRGYDFQSGELIWECGGLTRNVIPTPVTAFGMVFATSGFRGNVLQAIQLGRQGDLTGSDAVRWQLDRSTPYVPSPLLYGDKLYLFDRNSAILSCFQADTGVANFEKTRLDGMTEVYASPVGAADRVYLVGRNGTTKVIKRSSDLELLATNTLDDGFDASAAIVGNELLLRGKQYLYCIARK